MQAAPITLAGQQVPFWFLLSCLLLLQPSTASAQQNRSDWRFALLFPMIWAPDIRGDIRVGDDEYRVTIPFDEKIKDLDMGLIGEFYVHKGNWSGGLKVNYMRSRTREDTEGIKIPGGPNLIAPHKLETETEEGTIDFIFGYRIIDSLIIYGGARQFGQKFTFAITPLEDDGLGIDTKVNLVDESYRDAIVGLTWTSNFNERWSFTLSGDGNIAGDSDRNIFLEARIRLKLSEFNNLWFGYRGSRIKLTPDTDGDRITTDFRQHGPTIGWAFVF
jgi:hypothetical protein